jgi:hypothetical protein
MVHVELLSMPRGSQPGTRPDAWRLFGCRLASRTICCLSFPTSLNVGRPRLRSQIVLCMSLVLVVCSDCCCHIVQEKMMHCSSSWGTPTHYTTNLTAPLARMLATDE